MRSTLFSLLLLVGIAGGQTINMDQQIKGSRWPAWGTDTGAANAYAVTTIFPLPGPGLRTGSKIEFIATHQNTGASTLAVNGGTATALVNPPNLTLTSGNIAANTVIEAVYDGTRFQCITCASSGGTGVSGNGTFDPTTLSQLFDEFCGGSTTSGAIGELGWLSNAVGTGSFIRYTNNAAVNQLQHPCLSYLSVSGATNTEWLVLANINSATSTVLRADTLAWTMQASVSDGIDTGASRFDNKSTFGWSANTGTTAPGAGIYLQCISPASPTTVNFQCITSDGTTTTQNDSGIPCNNNFNFHDLKIKNDGAGNINFYVDGANVCTQNTNLPTTRVNPVFGVTNSNTSANTHQYGIDYFMLDITLSR